MKIDVNFLQFYFHIFFIQFTEEAVAPQPLPGLSKELFAVLVELLQMNSLSLSLSLLARMREVQGWHY